jgi:hypothetical protein
MSLNPLEPRVLRSAPHHFAWIGLLCLGLGGRLFNQAAREAEQKAAAEASRVAASVEARRVDSLGYVAQAESLSSIIRGDVLARDQIIHQSPYVVPHDSLHSLAVQVRIDSSTKLLRRAARNPSLLASASSQLTAIQAPIAPAQSLRIVELTSQIQAATATAEQAARNRDARAQRQREAQLRSRIPSGASARCRDGTYSYSRNRRGTCSHHGGVAQWL